MHLFIGGRSPSRENGGSCMADAAREKWSLTQEAFDALMAAIAPNREAAADRYLEIRRNLVRLFEWRGCPTPDEYADETLNRCARKVAEGEQIRDLASYSIGVARMLFREMGRANARAMCSLAEASEPQAPAVESTTSGEDRDECLRGCLAQISADNRDLILKYYQGEKSEKVKIRKALTQSLGIAESTLRMRALRVRETLQMCAKNCLERRQRKSL
jgi:DNA-directed RNA polymerase specialized sigma24 family protein